MLTVELASPEQTSIFGRRLGGMAEPGDVITLEGELGSGKTTLVQAIGQGLGVPAACYITSPTFNLLHEYPGRIPIYHMDLYRLSAAAEILSLGFDDYLYGDGLAVVEWAEKLGDLTPAARLHIRLLITAPTARRAVLTPFGSAWQKRLTNSNPAVINC